MRSVSENQTRAGGPMHSSAPHARRSVIVELFGPAAAGKTTLARAVVRELERREIPVRAISSARPAEQQPSLHTAELVQSHRLWTAPFIRASKIFGALATVTPWADVDPLIRQLMAELPPGSWLRTLRLRRYLMSLSRSLRRARLSPGVFVFDQGFVNALSSLALLADPVDMKALEKGVKLIPESDLLVRVDVPRDMLEARLHNRLSHQSALERLFENRIEQSLRQSELTEALDGLLRNNGRHSMRFDCLDSDNLESAVNAIVSEIMNKMHCISE